MPRTRIEQARYWAREAERLMAEFRDRPPSPERGAAASQVVVTAALVSAQLANFHLMRPEWDEDAED